MRGIGQGQKIHVFVIPEVLEKRNPLQSPHLYSFMNVDFMYFVVFICSIFPRVRVCLAISKVRDLMARERAAALDHHEDDEAEARPAETEAAPAAALAPASAAAAGSSDGVLKHIVSWLVVNSMRSEQTQWSMLCIQNIGNIYRKTAFDVMLSASTKLAAGGSMDGPVESGSQDPRKLLSPRDSLKVFEEDIDFSLEAAVPDPLPFEVTYLCLAKLGGGGSTSYSRA